MRDVPVPAAHVRFPPRWHNVLVPTRPAAATTVGMSLYTASKPVPVALQHALWLGALVTGGRVLPGRREAWSPPMAPQAWSALLAQWRDVTGRDIDGVAVYERLQSERANLTLLVCAGRASMLVRVRRDPDAFAAELAMSEAASSRPDALIHVPAAVGRGAVDDQHWVAYEALATRPHLPRYRLPADAFAEIAALVEAVVPRPAGTPTHWRGAHGDVVPWNLRRARGRTWLIDWEDARWAPPGLDELYLHAVVAALRRGPVRPVAASGHDDEARRELVRVVRSRPSASVEQRLLHRLLAALGE